MSSSKTTDENEQVSLIQSPKTGDGKKDVKKLPAFRNRYYDSKYRESTIENIDSKLGIFTTAMINRLRGGKYKPKGKPSSTPKTKQEALDNFWYDVLTKVKLGIVDLELFFEVSSRHQIDKLNENIEKIVFLKDHIPLEWKEKDNDGKEVDKKQGPFHTGFTVYPKEDLPIPQDMLMALKKQGIIEIVNRRGESHYDRNSPFKKLASSMFHTPIVNREPYDETLGESALDFIENGTNYLLDHNLQSQTEQPSRKQVTDALEILRGLRRARRLPEGTNRALYKFRHDQH